MKNQSLVTVYMPNHNYEEYISQSIESVINQSYLKWELIIILDGVVDESKKIATKYAKLYPKKMVR